MRRGIAVWTGILAIGLLGPGCDQQSTQNEPGGAESASSSEGGGGGTPSFTLRSTAFADGRPMPAKHSFDGGNVSPPLAWTDPPAGTKSFVLFCEDPDAMRINDALYTHWLLYNIPAERRSLPEDVGEAPQLPDGTRQGTCDMGTKHYAGPAPPSGTHHYHFTLYALDTTLDLPAGADKGQLREAIEGHVLGQAELMGTFSAE